jgi:hypothetical protein
MNINILASFELLNIKMGTMKMGMTIPLSNNHPYLEVLRVASCALV